MRSRILTVTRDTHFAAAPRAIAHAYWGPRIRRAIAETETVLAAFRADGWFAEGPHHVPEDTVRIMLLSLALEPTPSVIRRVTGIPSGVSHRVIRNMRLHRILRGDTFHVEWCDEHGWMALMLDAMVVEGFVERVPEEDAVPRTGNHQLSDEQIAEIKKMAAEGSGIREIERATGHHRDTVSRYIGGGDKSLGMRRYHARRKADGLPPILPPWRREKPSQSEDQGGEGGLPP